MRRNGKTERDLLRFEREIWDSGLITVAGIDEAGRGPLAGPVVAAAVVFEPGNVPDGMRDSKEISPGRRQKLFEVICRNAVSVGIGIVSEKVIDRINILRATRLAMVKATKSLKCTPQFCLVDGFVMSDSLPRQKAIIDGDKLSASVAAASIIAKVTRDRIMIEQDAVYPAYGFASHKGYGTKMHIKQLRRYGPCKLHRLTFHPVKLMAGRERTWERKKSGLAG